MKLKCNFLISLSLFFFCCKLTSPEDEQPPNTPPYASFSISPSAGTTETNFTFSASGCLDRQDSLSELQVRWDWENDNVWDTDFSTNKTATHKYTFEGIIWVALEVKDTGGLTNASSKKIYVSKLYSIETGTVKDIEGNTYKTVKIGHQWWTAENLKVAHYRNGEPIPNCADSSEWDNLSTGALCVLDNNITNRDIYGYLYNWYAANDSRNIAPEGWHVATDEEWKQLEMTLGMSRVAADYYGPEYRGTIEGGKLKSTGTLEDGTGLWPSPNTGATNVSCFSALPGGGGSCIPGKPDSYDRIHYNAYFWSSTDFGDSEGRSAWLRWLSSYNSEINRGFSMKEDMFSVRCIKD